MDSQPQECADVAVNLHRISWSSWRPQDKLDRKVKFNQWRPMTFIIDEEVYKESFMIVVNNILKVNGRTF